MQYLWLKKTIKSRNSSLTSITMPFSFSSISDVNVSREIKIDTMYLKNCEDPVYLGLYFYEFVTETTSHFICDHQSLKSLAFKTS